MQGFDNLSKELISTLLIYIMYRDRGYGKVSPFFLLIDKNYFCL